MSEAENSIDSGKAWKSVTRPIPKREGAEVSLMNGPPPTAPKPRTGVAPEIVTKPDGSKVWAYLYSVPADSKSATQNGPKIHYPRTDELVKSNKPKLKRFHRFVPEQNANFNSRGGKMFQKQKKRMNEYVLTAPANHNSQPYQTDDLPVEERRATLPREYNRHSSVGSRHTPAPVNNTMNAKSNRKMKGPVIRPLRSPPPQWKAKVDAGYSYSNAPQHRARMWRQGSQEAGYESAPPEDLEYEDAEFAYFTDDGGAYPRSLHASRADSRGEGPSTAAFYFNAKYQNRPRYHRRPYISRDAFVTTPYAENDFNARAVGWSRGYAEQY